MPAMAAPLRGRTYSASTAARAVHPNRAIFGKPMKLMLLLKVDNGGDDRGEGQDGEHRGR